MKTINIVVLLFALAIVSSVSGQVSYPDNDNGAPPGSYLGWDHPRDLDFKTNDILRMQLMQTQTSTINGFPAISQDGYLGLSDELNFFNPGGTGPFSMLHLNGENDGSTPQQQGWRPWMRYGMTVTSNRDLMYVGHLDRGETDETDAVITWSDNTFGPSGPDNLRFIFTSGDGTAAPGDEDSFYGLEAGRFSGEGNFGCGDFSPSGANEQPTHQFDVNGQARVRDVPDAQSQVLITGREMDAEGDYLLTHLAFTGNSNEVLAGDGTWVDPAGVGCDWDVVNGGDDVAMGYGPTACVGRAVGIGTQVPQAKLEVDFDGELPEGFEDIAIDAIARTTNAGQASDRIAVRGTSLNEEEEFIASSYGGYFTAYGGTKTYGVFAESFRSPLLNLFTTNIGAVGKSVGISGEGHDNIGVQGLASNAYSNCGVMGEASYYDNLGGPTPMWAIGVQGSACGASRNIGVFGKIPSTFVCSTGVRYAGYFEGDIYTTGTYLPSDESLKLNIEDFASGLEVINQLNPKTYIYDTESFGNMNLPTGNQFGLIADELQEVLPNLTKTVVSPGEKDEDGNEIFPEVEFTGVNYSGLVPILISAVKEQQAVIDSQNQTLAQVLDQLDDLQQQINNCCNADGARSFGAQDEDSKPVFGENILHQNAPNPFHSQTSISYELEQGGKVMLNIFDRNGKPLATLVEAEQQAGEYRYEWDASGLPAGVYNYALYVDGELLVKKAIKLAD